MRTPRGWAEGCPYPSQLSETQVLPSQLSETQVLSLEASGFRRLSPGGGGGGELRLLSCFSQTSVLQLQQPCVLFCFFFVFCLSRAASAAYGGSQASGGIGAVAAGLHHSSPQGRLLNPLPRPGIEPAPSRIRSR